MTPQRLELLRAQVQQEMEIPIKEHFSKLEEVSDLYPSPSQSTGRNAQHYKQASAQASFTASHGLIRKHTRRDIKEWEKESWSPVSPKWISP